jgi:hypothetical protein
MKIRSIGTCVLALLVWACGGTPGTDALQATGRLELPLTSTSSDGVTYRLVGATFTINGPENVTITDTSAPTVSVALTSGLYTVQLGGNWLLERMDAPGQALQAQLISPNPMPFTLGEGQTRTVRFLFKTPADGDVDLGIQVDTGGWISGTMDFTNAPPNGPDDIFAELAGKTVPFTISFESSTLFREGGFNQRLRVETSPITLQFGGAPSELIQDRIIPVLEGGSPLVFRLENAGSGMIAFSGFDLHGLSEPFTLRVFASMPFPGAVDAEGFPKPQDFEFETPVGMEFHGNPWSDINGMASGNVQPQ